MSKICDSCKQSMPQGGGGAEIWITDPTPDFRNMSVDTFDTLPITTRQPPRLDICPSCLLRLVDTLALPPDTFTPRLPPAEPPTPAGALTEEDLVELGLKEKP